MVDELTRQRFRVKTDAIAGPFLMLPYSQLKAVCDVLDRHGIHYWTDSFAISLDGKPAQILINFGRKGDAAGIQAALDEAG